MTAESRPGTIGPRLGEESDAGDSSDALGGGAGFSGLAGGGSERFDAEGAGFACAVAEE
jgi:hypothetical protein